MRGTFQFVTGTATMCLFDLASLKHRVEEPSDWWSIPEDELAEVNAGNCLFSISAPMDCTKCYGVWTSRIQLAQCRKVGRYSICKFQPAAYFWVQLKMSAGRAGAG